MKIKVRFVQGGRGGYTYEWTGDSTLGIGDKVFTPSGEAVVTALSSDYVGPLVSINTRSLDNTRIHLTATDLSEAAVCAAQRIRSSKGLNHASTYKRSMAIRIEEEIIGILGEMACCKAFGIPFALNLGRFHHEADLLGCFDVRAIGKRGHRCIIRDNDPDDRLTILVLVEYPIADILGYIRSGDAKDPRWLDNPNDYRMSWFVPASELHQLFR
jgi:hypothetical protein